MQPAETTDSEAMGQTEAASFQRGFSQEIDILEVLRYLWGSRWLLLLCAAIGMAAALAYAIAAPTTYVAITSIKAPADSDLAPINEVQLLKVGPNEAYRKVLDVLYNDELLAEIYGEQLAGWQSANRVALAEAHNGVAADAGDVISVRLPRTMRARFYNSEITEILVRHPNQDFAVSLANRSVEHANAIAVQELTDESRRLLRFRLDSIEGKLQLLRQLTEGHRAALNDVPAQAAARDDAGETEDRISRPLLDTRGAERSEFFSDTEDELRYQHALITEYMTRSFEGLSLVAVHEEATLPADQVGPNTLLTMFIGVIAGALLGVLVALARAVRQRGAEA